MMVPFMRGWSLHVYGKRPAAVNVCCHDCPRPSTLESKELEVAVCGTRSSLFHSTTVPFLTLSVLGENCIFRMDTFTIATAPDSAATSVPGRPASAGAAFKSVKLNRSARPATAGTNTVRQNINDAQSPRDAFI